MAVLDGCHESRYAVKIEEMDCPDCGEVIEYYIRDGVLAADARCEKCGYTISAGTKEIPDGT